MAVFRNVVVTIPPEAKVVSTTGRVYIIQEHIYLKDRQYNEDKRIDIGWLNDTNGKTMNPNTKFAELYPLEFNAAAKGKVATLVKQAGVFSFGLAVSEDSGLYQAMVDGCGPDYANTIMDFALYSILSKTNVAKDFSTIMKKQVLFGDKLHEDTWYSNFFCKQLSSEMIESFRDHWAKQCVAHGINNVWICIDGSNNDCRSKNVDYAEYGAAKSHIHVPIYSYMYAVSAVDGTPVTYRLYRGGRIDGKAFSEIITFLRSYGIEIAGVILDRGFCTIDCFELIIQFKYDYVIKIKENFSGFYKMVNQYGHLIRMKAEYGIGNGLYAICGEGKVFSKYDFVSKMVLVYDGVNGPERANYLLDNVLAEIDRLQKVTDDPARETIPKADSKYAGYIQQTLVPVEVCWKPKAELNLSEEDTAMVSEEICRLQGLSKDLIDKGLPSVSDKYKDYIECEVIRSRVKWVRDSERLQKAMDEKGFYVLAYSLKDKAAKAADVVNIYGLRDTSEKQYMVLKSQLGYHVSRSHSVEGTESRHLCGFVAGIIRNDLKKACAEVNYELNIAIKELNFLCVQRLADNTYTFVRNADERQLDLLRYLDLAQEDLNYVANLESQRANNQVFDQIHKFPNRTFREISIVPAEKVKPKKKAAAKTEETETEFKEKAKKRGGGRTKGSKNKKPAVNAKEKRRAARMAAEQKNVS